MSPPRDSTFEQVKLQVEPEGGPFGGVFENWLVVQERILEELRSAAKTNTESTRNLQQLVCRVMSHYEKYYRAKSESVKQNVLQMLTPPWRSGLEGAFLWIGGWRPSMAFQLLYSISGIQLEARLSELLEGLRTGDLGDLSSSQLREVNELQSQTVREERELTEILAAQQDTVADSPMVELSHMATELMRIPHSGTRERIANESVNERVESTLGSKEEKLKEIFKKADDLRLRTLRKVVDVLSPIQAVHFLITGAELHLRVHEWGMNKDADVSPQQH